MTDEELQELIRKIFRLRAETQNLEIKAAQNGPPARLYDTLSSFSNQDEGGVIVFGIDESADFAPCGVYDVQDLQKRVAEQCRQMEPQVRPVLTVTEANGKFFVSAEIPGLDLADRPCFYAGKGRLRGSYIRIGDADELMNEYEIYSFENFRRKTQDDVRPVERAKMDSLDESLLDEYVARLKRDRPNLALMEKDQICELMSLTKNGVPTLASVLLFGKYPQAFYPQLCIIATRIPGTKIGDVGFGGERFSDSKRIDGTLSQMLEGGMSFTRQNTRTALRVSQSGVRSDHAEYPMKAVREAILNALVHRDYSIHTESMPIQLQLFEDRMEVHSPGGLYGRIKIDQLGKIQPDTRNPELAVAMELLGVTENRYSGIPAMRQSLREAGMPEPTFKDDRGTFSVTFNKHAPENENFIMPAPSPERLLEFCAVPRTRQEIADWLGLKTVSHATKKYIMPLVAEGLLVMSNPRKPKSAIQKFTAVDSVARKK